MIKQPAFANAGLLGDRIQRQPADAVLADDIVGGSEDGGSDKKPPAAGWGFLDLLAVSSRA